jgi:hypothetical protein
MVKVAKSKIKLSLPVIVADIVYKFQIICLKRIKFNEWKLEKLVFLLVNHSRTEKIVDVQNQT